MRMGPRPRKAVLTVHVVSTVGWIGALAAYLVLALTASTSGSVETARAAVISMELLYYALVPLAALALLTGLIQALGTNWGLFRHHWVFTKFVMTVVAIGVMMNNLPKVSAHAEHGMHASVADVHNAAHHDLQHAAGGMVVLLAAVILGVYRPWGLTPYGRRKKAQRQGRGQEPRPVREDRRPPVGELERPAG